MLEIPKPIIGVDKDNVLIDLTPALHNFHNRHYGTSIILGGSYSYSLRELWGCTREQEVERVFHFYESEDFKNLAPVEEAVEAVAKLKQKYDLVVISSRPRFILDATQQSLNRYFPGCFSDVYLTDGYGSPNSAKKKSQICLELGVGVMIDDHIEEVRDCVASGIPTLLFRRPTNGIFSDEQLKAERITPARDWPHVLEILQAGSKLRD